MCTVSWLHQDDGYQLLCNRDEKRSRLRATGPEIKLREGVRFIAPTDGDAGGTWIGTNEFGISLCLLNGASNAEHERVYESRGLLLPNLLNASSLLEVHVRVWQADLSPFAPFSLAILEPGRQTSVIDWDGQEKAILPCADPYMPLVSSSFDPSGVQARRRDEFRRRLNSAGKLDPAVLFAFHESHGAQANAYSPCMHRPDAETVSLSWIKVTESRVEFFYSPGAPCRWSPVEVQELPRFE